MKSLNRADPNSATQVLAKLFPQPEIARQALEILAASLRIAHEQGAANWGVTLDARAIRLNAGRGAALSLAPNQLQFAVDARDINEPTRQSLGASWQAPGHFKTAPHAARVTLRAEQLAASWPLIARAHARFVAEAARGFESRAPHSLAWRDAHSPAVLELLRRELGREIPAPTYAAPPAPDQNDAPFDWPGVLAGALRARGLQFPDAHLSAFFVALASKGFAILSGPSGVGKTALATAFAALLPQPGDGAGAFSLSETAARDGKIALPAAMLRVHGAPRAGESRAATVICEGAAHPCKIVGEAGHEGEREGGAHLLLRGAARRFLGAHVGDALCLESEWDGDTSRPTFRLLLRPRPAPDAGSNALFLPVRPDWRDATPLLGYFNALGNRYEWTPFLRFLLRADAGFRARDGLAYFVVFDEMNLARVEWYFADLLSVLEAGRDESGRTRQPLRFDFDLKAGGELPPRELFLPPNLYFVGTINADETAQPLSPKVLDRAWTIEAPPADFSNYPPPAREFTISAAQRERLLTRFTRGGRFAAPDKSLVAAQLELFPARRDDLSHLNAALNESGAGFGFRVFDEVLTFGAVAREAGLFEERVAFDWAVALKIAPRLRGSRGQCEASLRDLLAWGEARDLEHSAQAARRALAQLERDGFLP